MMKLQKILALGATGLMVGITALPAGAAYAAEDVTLETAARRYISARSGQQIARSRTSLTPTVPNRYTSTDRGVAGVTRLRSGRSVSTLARYGTMTRYQTPTPVISTTVAEQFPGETPVLYNALLDQSAYTSLEQSGEFSFGVDEATGTLEYTMKSVNTGGQSFNTHTNLDLEVKSEKDGSFYMDIDVVNKDQDMLYFRLNEFFMSTASADDDMAMIQALIAEFTGQWYSVDLTELGEEAFNMSPLMLNNQALLEKQLMAAIRSTKPLVITDVNANQFRRGSIVRAYGVDLDGSSLMNMMLKLSNIVGEDSPSFSRSEQQELQEFVHMFNNEGKATVYVDETTKKLKEIQVDMRGTEFTDLTDGLDYLTWEHTIDRYNSSGIQVVLPNNAEDFETKIQEVFGFGSSESLEYQYNSIDSRDPEDDIRLLRL